VGVKIGLSIIYFGVNSPTGIPLTFRTVFQCLCL